MLVIKQGKFEFWFLSDALNFNIAFFLANKKHIDNAAGSGGYPLPKSKLEQVNQPGESEDNLDEASRTYGSILLTISPS